MVALCLIFVGLVTCVLCAWFLLKQTHEDIEDPDAVPDMESSENYKSAHIVFSDDISNRDTKPHHAHDEIPPWERSDYSPEQYAEPNNAVMDSIYQVPLYEETASNFRLSMETVLAKSGVPTPTASQWNMILSPDRATRVVAGAGSGKSTGLSLRVVFLHKFLGMPLNQITVVTFTRASRADMVKKLIRDMGLFGVGLSEDAARRVVRTFHSMILDQASKTGGQVNFFEQMGARSENTEDTDSLGSLNTKQVDHLRKLYASLYHTSKPFGKAIGQVLLEKISAPRLTQYTDDEGLDRAMVVAEPRDRLIAQAITDAWLAKEGFDQKSHVIGWGLTAIKTSRSGGVWYANGRVISTGMPIMLGCGGIRDAAKNPLDPAKYSIGDADKGRTLGFMANVRVKVVATIATEKYLYIETDEDLSDFYTLIDWVYKGNIPGDRDTFPAFSVRIPGDSSSVSIFEGLYSIGTFIASMGLDVSSVASDLADQMAKTKRPLEANLCRALTEFWPAMHQGENSTYDDLFLKHGNFDYVNSLSKDSLLPMNHLLIDEFQDISGQIVQWIQTVHKVLAAQGESPSLLAVGDDWQSVYGWRGSDPGFMIRFDKHFGVSKMVVMNENFRSGQCIINTAESLLGNLSGSAIGKHGVSSGHAAEMLGDVQVCSGSDNEVFTLVSKLKSEEPTADIFILSRTNEGLTPFRDLAKKKQATLLTMHRAKGLEADYVIVKGDCNYTNTSPVRNAIYAIAGMGTSYDQSQLDESLRLAYVAITRAKKKVYWFGDNEKPGGAFSLLCGTLASSPSTYQICAENLAVQGG